MRDEQARNGHSGWGVQIGQALAIIIPAIMTGIAGYFVAPKAAESATAVNSVVANAQIQPTDDTGSKLADDESQITSLRNQIQKLAPNNQAVAINSFSTPQGVDRDACDEGIADELNRSGVNFKKYANLYKFSDSSDGDYIYCDPRGNVVTFSVGDESSDRVDYLMSFVKAEWPNS